MTTKLWLNVDHNLWTYLFQPGELYIVLWAITAVGDYVEGSGLHWAWFEAGTYSGTTVFKHVFKEKHMYRAIECH